MKNSNGIRMDLDESSISEFEEKAFLNYTYKKHSEYSGIINESYFMQFSKLNSKAFCV